MESIIDDKDKIETIIKDAVIARAALALKHLLLHGTVVIQPWSLHSEAAEVIYDPDNH